MSSDTYADKVLIKWDPQHEDWRLFLAWLSKKIRKMYKWTPIEGKWEGTLKEIQTLDRSKFWNYHLLVQLLTSFGLEIAHDKKAFNVLGPAPRIGRCDGEQESENAKEYPSERFFKKTVTFDRETLLQFYKKCIKYEKKLREYHTKNLESSSCLEDSRHGNLVTIYKLESDFKTREREKTDDQYIMPLEYQNRRPNGSPAINSSYEDFKENFNIFSGGSLSKLNWANVVAAGDAVTNALLPLPQLRQSVQEKARYYEHTYPSGAVDLFLYGMNKKEAIEKIKEIELRIRLSTGCDTFVIRTKYALTITSKYPCRHVQIVLRLYTSISQILTSFDIDCACTAYNGMHVYASPRALIAFATQTNTVDLSRQSPSYENRLIEYARKGFEIFCPLLKRSNVNKDIYKLDLLQTRGLAKLLVLEAQEFGTLGDVAKSEKLITHDLSDCEITDIPYGPRWRAKDIERLLTLEEYDLNKNRKGFHRHRRFFGSIETVLEGHCSFREDLFCQMSVALKDDKFYISGKIEFIEDDPNRQESGSFNPTTTDEWEKMAYDKTDALKDLPNKPLTPVPFATNPSASTRRISKTETGPVEKAEATLKLGQNEHEIVRSRGMSNRECQEDHLDSDIFRKERAFLSSIYQEILIFSLPH